MGIGMGIGIGIGIDIGIDSGRCCAEEGEGNAERGRGGFGKGYAAMP